MKSLLSIPALLWIVGCSVEEAKARDPIDEVRTSVVAQEEDDPPSTPPITPKKDSKPCPHHTPSAGARCSTDDRCYYAVENEYAIITLTECRCIGDAWTCFPP